MQKPKYSAGMIITFRNNGRTYQGRILYVIAGDDGYEYRVQFESGEETLSEAEIDKFGEVER